MLFRCEKCGCVESVEFGRYFCKEDTKMWDEGNLGKALCSECAPSTYKNGTLTKYGKWHNHFPKVSADGMYIDIHGFLWKVDDVKNTSFSSIHKIIGVVGLDVFKKNLCDG